MTDRFNFYDIYGYVLPGAIALFLSWLPFGLVLGEWPSATLTSAILAIVLAYVAGHILQALADGAFPSKVRDLRGVLRHPSELLLETDPAAMSPAVPSLAPAFILQLRRQILNKFGMDIKEQPQRNIAFFQCRTYLILKKASAYAEQQHGMYALLRGLTATFTGVSALYFGFAASGLASLGNFPHVQPLCLYAALLISLTICGLFAWLSGRNSGEGQRTWRCLVFWTIIATLVFSGFLFDSELSDKRLNVPFHASHSSLRFTTNTLRFEQSAISETNAVQFQKVVKAISQLSRSAAVNTYGPFIFLVMCLFSAVLARISHTAFRASAIGFATTVYRDFHALAPRPRTRKLQNMPMNFSCLLAKRLVEIEIIG